MKTSLFAMTFVIAQFFTGAVFAQFSDDIPNEVDMPEFFDLSTLEVVISTGFGYKLEPIPDQTVQVERSYLESMKSTLIYGGEVIYYYKEKAGFGLNYSLFATNKKVEWPRNYRSEKVRTHFIGPMYVVRESTSDDKWFFEPRFGLGYIYYQNDGLFKDTNDYNFAEPVEENYRAHSVGLMAGFTVIRKVSSHFGVGMGVNLIAGLAGTKNNYWQTQAQKEDLSRFEFSIKLHYLN